MTLPGCNRCGDGFNAPADCDRSEAAARDCRQSVRRQIGRCLVDFLARADYDRRELHFDLMAQHHRPAERIARLRATVERRRGELGLAAQALQPELAL